MCILRINVYRLSQNIIGHEFCSKISEIRRKKYLKG